LNQRAVGRGQRKDARRWCFALALAAFLSCTDEPRGNATPPAPASSDQGQEKRPPHDFRYRIPRSDEGWESAIRDPDTPPVRLSGNEPEYTDLARRARVSGIVILEILIDDHGNVAGAQVRQDLPFGLTQSAIEAVRSWKFEPARHNGKRVPTVQRVTLTFQRPAN
jgi:TonB family protein